MRPSPSSCRRKEGFTLVEVLITTALLVAGLAGVWGLAQGIMRTNALTAQTTDAGARGQQMIEQLAAGSYAAMASGTDTTGVFERAWTVTENAALGTKTIDMTVRWIGQWGDTHTIGLRTMRGR
jgi:prepilin-type N-terminal cleavage/methylation domain-containing protein